MLTMFPCIVRMYLLVVNVVLFFWLKMIQNQFLGKYITSQCSKLSPYLSPIHNSKLELMFPRFSHKVQACRHLSLHHYDTSVNIKKESLLYRT